MRGSRRTSSGSSLEQPLVALARDELRDHADDQRISGQRERLEQARPRARLRPEAAGIDRARNPYDLVPREAAADELRLDRARQRDDAGVQPILQPRPERGLGGIDAPCDDRGNALERGCDAAVEIGTAARMDVHDVGLDGAQRSARAGDQGQVEIARHR